MHPSLCQLVITGYDCQASLATTKAYAAYATHDDGVQGTCRSPKMCFILSRKINSNVRASQHGRSSAAKMHGGKKAVDKWFCLVVFRSFLSQCSNWKTVQGYSRSCKLQFINPLMGTLKPQSNGQLYSNTVIGTLAVDGWTVTFGIARRGLGPRPVPSSLYQM